MFVSVGRSVPKLADSSQPSVLFLLPAGTVAQSLWQQRIVYNLSHSEYFQLVMLGEAYLRHPRLAIEARIELVEGLQTRDVVCLWIPLAAGLRRTDAAATTLIREIERLITLDTTGKTRFLLAMEPGTAIGGMVRSLIEHRYLRPCYTDFQLLCNAAKSLIMPSDLKP